MPSKAGVGVSSSAGTRGECANQERRGQEEEQCSSSHKDDAIVFADGCENRRRWSGLERFSIGRVFTGVQRI